MPPTFDEGRQRLVAVIGGGIGAATARALHQRGGRIAVADVDLSAAQAVAQACAGHGMHVDVLDADAIEAACTAIERDAGPVYGLVNAAALFQRRHPPETFLLE